jgi:acetyl esterase/lipase
MPCAPCTPELLDEATDYRNPPTEIALPATEKDYRRPRQFISLTFFRDAIVSEFLLRGLVKGEDGTAALPQKGSVSVEEIDDISPLHLCSRYQFPPVYQAIGTSDEIFSVNHIHEFHAALRAQGIPTEKIIIPGAVHAFDVREEVGSQVHHRILTPAVAWVAQWAGRGGG